jgi:hypothetical protein
VPDGGTDDLAVSGELDDADGDGDLHSLAGPPATTLVVLADETDYAAAVGQPGLPRSLPRPSRNAGNIYS